ncbi:putative thioredoxin-like protein [Lupinus albus]|uniref:Putative thioredoxin-like protein n=1 Tax=Lupinus albus TaxID=3870 RepID=A0A6A4QL33_LUPAL|nr:putative thioredoxin-like protein [Lupinus albus]
MGCVSSNLLNHEDEFTQLGSTALGHHIVSLTSTTYGLLTLDPPPSSAAGTTTVSTPSTPPSRITFPSSLSEPKSLWSEPKPLRSEPDEVINSWELMAGLDNIESFRFSPLPPPNPFKDSNFNKENSNPNRLTNGSRIYPKKPVSTVMKRFERICPPNGENRVVIYTTTLRGVRRTFEACNAVRSGFEAFGVLICERDVSMDSGFKEELRELLNGKEKDAMVPPRVFVKGFYIGGAEEMLKVVEEGFLGDLLEGLPRKKVGDICDGCGDMRFLPCFQCNGSCKVVKEEDVGHKQRRKSVMVKCSDCNENGLVVCPLCG